MPDSLQPDPIEQVRLFLLSCTQVTAIVSTRISVSLQSGEASIRLALVSNNSVCPAVGDPLVQVECWGKANTPDDGKAGDLARTVIAQLVDFRGVWAAGTVAGASLDSHFSAPDETSGRPRELLQVRLLSHATV